MQRNDSKRKNQEQRYHHRLARRNAKNQPINNFLLFSNGNSELHFENVKLDQQLIFTVLALSCAMQLGIMPSVSAMKVKKEASPTLNNKLKTQMEINATCSKPPFIAANKPEMRLDFHNRKIIPTSCVDHLKQNAPLSTACQNDAVKLYAFSTNANPNKAVLAKIEKARNKLQESTLIKEANKITKATKFTAEQQDKFAQYIQTLRRLETIHLSAKYSKEIGAGKCHEHTSYNAMNIFKINKDYSTFTKLQTVEVENNDDNHNFLLIDSEAQDVEIKNNPSQVRKILTELKQGYICDSWNEGYYEKLSANKNDLYRRWDSITINTLSLEFEVSDLPKSAAAFIEKKLSDFHLEHKLKKSASDNQKKQRVDL